MSGEVQKYGALKGWQPQKESKNKGKDVEEIEDEVVV